MEAFQENSQLDHQQRHLDLGLQSDPPIDNDNLVEIIAQQLQNLVISCQDELLDRDLSSSSVLMDEEDELKRAFDEELRHLVVKEAVNEAFQAQSFNGSGENNYRDVSQFVDEAMERYGLRKVIEEDPKECRVLEEPEIGKSGIGCEQSDDEKVVEHQEEDLREKHEIEIEDGGGSGEIVGDDNNGEGMRSEDGDDRDFEDLENQSENAGGDGGEGGSVTAPDDGRLKRYHYPLRPDAEDCSYYMRTGMCKFGSNCKFNHPLRRRNQQPPKETKKQKEESSERPGQIECKYYLSPAGCKYGKACKFNHSRGKSVIIPVVEYNFLGLPIRPGEKECPYYMRNGSCKYGPNCRFNHPDPTAVGGGDAPIPTTYGTDGPVPLQSASWSAPRTPDGPATFVPMMYSPTQSIPPPNPDWNGYQAPGHVYPNSERGLPIPPAFFLNNPPTDTNMYTHHQQQQQQHQHQHQHQQQQPHQMVVSDYPERPGQPECSYFMKTGDCKYRTACKFHHPRGRITKTPPSLLSDKGLPLRPDQNICSHYSRYGICKYGPACKYDHPANYSNSGSEGHGSDGPLIQQSV